MTKCGGVQVLAVVAVVFTVAVVVHLFPPGEPGRAGRDGRDACDCQNSAMESPGLLGSQGEAGVQGPKGDGPGSVNDTHLQSVTSDVLSEVKKYSKFMTPTWIHDNANFPDRNVILDNHDGHSKRLTLMVKQAYQLLFSVPLDFKRHPQGEDIFKITLSIQLQTPSSGFIDFNFFLFGIGNLGGIAAAGIVHSNLPSSEQLINLYPEPISSSNIYSGVISADHTDSSDISAPFDEEATFIYKPAENWGAFYSGTGVSTGIFPLRPNISEPLHLVIIGDTVDQVYKIQYIHVEITSS